MYRGIIPMKKAFGRGLYTTLAEGLFRLYKLYFDFTVKYLSYSLQGGSSKVLLPCLNSRLIALRGAELFGELFLGQAVLFAHLQNQIGNLQLFAEFIVVFLEFGVFQLFVQVGLKIGGFFKILFTDFIHI